MVPRGDRSTPHMDGDRVVLGRGYCSESGACWVPQLLPLLLLLSSAVITRFHGLPMGGTGYSAFCMYLFCLFSHVVAVCRCFFFFSGTFTLILSSAPFRFVFVEASGGGSLNITLCFRREISGICLCHFWKLDSVKWSDLPLPPSLSLLHFFFFSLRFALLM